MLDRQSEIVQYYCSEQKIIKGDDSSNMHIIINSAPLISSVEGEQKFGIKMDDFLRGNTGKILSDDIFDFRNYSLLNLLNLQQALFLEYKFIKSEKIDQVQKKLSYYFAEIKPLHKDAQVVITYNKPNFYILCFQKKSYSIIRGFINYLPSYKIKMLFFWPDKKLQQKQIKTPLSISPPYPLMRNLLQAIKKINSKYENKEWGENQMSRNK